MSSYERISDIDVDAGGAADQQMSPLIAHDEIRDTLAEMPSFNRKLSRRRVSYIFFSI